jgi:hypothetical protein
MRSRTTLALVFLLSALSPARADDAALHRCRALTEPAARLACYDAVPLAATPPGSAAPPPAAVEPSASFGLDKPEDKTKEIRSHISGRFEGWRPGERIRLANRQVWQVSDDSSGVYFLLDPKVTVRRASMGTFMLDIEGARRMPRVRRLE